ncbi:MAG: hypothetical protein NTV49_02330 [Kiritimatiellaeota bacterium]|nr:hypothetical protein [Kiritimatiellota bacterium]
MKLSTRELLVATGLVLVAVLAVTAWLVSAQAGEWKRSLQTQKALRRRVQAAQQLVDQSGAAARRLQAVQRQLPDYPPDKDVTSEQMTILERLAQEQGLTLIRRDPEREKASGELCELSIHCMWEAGLEGLVRFLYALQQQGATFDISQLTVMPAASAAGPLKGTFTVNCSYNRTGPAAEPPPKTAPKVTP